MKKKMLFITTQFPYPLDNGGKIGAYNGLLVVSKIFDVTVLSFSEEPHYIEEGIAYYRRVLPGIKFCEPVIHDVHIRSNPIKLIKAISQGYIRNEPYIVSKFYDKKMYSVIDEMFKQWDHWDYVFIDYLNMWAYGEYIHRHYNNKVDHLILKDHNIENEIVKQEAFSSSIGKKQILIPEWRRTRKYEIEAIQKAEIVFSVCDSNTQWMKKYNANSWTMLPTFSMKENVKKKVTNPSILYIGNLSWKSNMDGLRWFTEDVFDKVLERIPNVKLTIVGSGPSESPFQNKTNIDYLGYVKDISNIYDDQLVFIVPLFEGSGIRIKILEAFNNEIAVVSTSLGCSTIGAENGVHLFIADTIDEFANAVITLLNDTSTNNKIRMEGKKLLRDRFTIEARQKEFLQILGETAGNE